MATAQQPKPRAKYPQHEHSDQHKALRAREEFGSRRRLRDAAELRPSAEVACERIREFAWDVGAEARAERPDAWMAGAARALGLGEDYGRLIINGTVYRVGTRTVDAVAKHTGVPVRIFYDPEL